jgi:hypothetical protein
MVKRQWIIFNVRQTDQSRMSSIGSPTPLRKEHNITDFEWNKWDLPHNSSIPAIELRFQNPKLPGQDVSHFNKLEYRVQNNRKVYHVECDKRFLLGVRRLTQLAKDFNIVTKTWGKHPHMTEVVDKDSTPTEIKRLCCVAQVHANYQCSMIVEDISGITSLNELAAVMAADGMTEIGQMSLRQILLKSLKLNDRHQLIAKVHQMPAPISPVQAAVP